MKSVTIIDDTYRRHITTEVTSENLEAMQKLLGPAIDIGMKLPMKDKAGHTAQETMEMHIGYSGQALLNAIKRSTRWIRNGGLNKLAPRHIALAMMAHQKADPSRFGDMVQEAM